MFSTAGLARVSARHPWFVVIFWIILLVLSGVAAGGLGDTFVTDVNFTNRPESVRADDLIKQRMRGGVDETLSETVILRSDSLTVDDVRFRQTAERAASNLTALSGLVASVTSYYDAVAAGAPDAESLVSSDRHTMWMPMTLVEDFDQTGDDVDTLLAS